MSEKLVIWTYDWVPKGPRGFVRDLRLRWAAEEAGLSYEVCTVPFEDRETNHLDRQPFGQVPWRSHDFRERCGPAALSLSQREADAARSGWRSTNASVGSRRAQLDRDGHCAVVVPENNRRD